LIFIKFGAGFDIILNPSIDTGKYEKVIDYQRIDYPLWLTAQETLTNSLPLISKRWMGKRSIPVISATMVILLFSASGHLV
jgi:hypothetical protein